MSDATLLEPSLPGTGGAPSKAADDVREKLLRNATTFLNNPQVKTSPLSRRVNFLLSKGLSKEEVVEAFRRAGQPQTLDAISAAMAGTTSAVVHPPPAPAVPVVPPSALPVPPNHPPPPPPAPVGWTWKEYFISGTVAVAGFGAAVAGLQAFSPFTIVRKERLAKLRRGAKIAPPSGSDSEPAPLRSQSSVLLQPQPSALFVAAQAKTPMPALPAPTAATMDASAVQDAIAKMEAAQKDLADSKERLEKEQREKAELALTNGKLRGQLQTAQRNIERNAQQLVSTQEELTRLKEKAVETPAAAPPTVPAATTLNGGDGQAPVTTGAPSTAETEPANADGR